jgi:hypothetical protein
MLFLVGAQRSGTNWLQGMLKLHPDVIALPSETQLLSYGMHVLERFTQQGPMESWVTSRTFMERDEFADAARDFCDSVFGQLAAKLDSSAPYILERTPNNAERMDLVADIYPDGRAVHIIRDGRDVARSLVSMAWGPRDIAEAARTWRTAVETARQAGPKMAAYVEVRYEELLASPKDTYTHILRGLGLSVDPVVVEAAVVESGIPVNIDRHKPAVGAGKWRTSWSRADLGAFEAEAGELLYDVLGYPRVEPGSNEPRPGLIARARGRAKQLQTRTRQRPPATAQVRNPEAVAQRITNDVIGFLAQGRIDEALTRFAPDAQIRTVTPDEEWRGRGSTALEKLRTVMCAEGPDWGEQVRGHVYFALPMTTAVLRYRRGSEVTERVVVTRVHGELVTRFAYYRFDSAAGSHPA